MITVYVSDSDIQISKKSQIKDPLYYAINRQMPGRKNIEIGVSEVIVYFYGDRGQKINTIYFPLVKLARDFLNSFRFSKNFYPPKEVEPFYFNLIPL